MTVFKTNRLRLKKLSFPLHCRGASLFATAVTFLCLYCNVSFAQAGEPSSVFLGHSLTQHDSILVVDDDNADVYAWLPDAPRTPASVVKLVTALMSIEKWGLDHCFSTQFYLADEALWVQGRGDPMLVSEELDKLAAQLQLRFSALNVPTPQLINIDASYFAPTRVPGRGGTNDPYNAPLSAVAANFNTVSLKRVSGELMSGEPQTPLTKLARSLAVTEKIGARPSRINLRTASLAQRQFGEILAAKLGANSAIQVDQHLPDHAELVYTHCNSMPLAQVLRGALKYSNNFIANQLFLLLAQHDDAGPLDFSRAQDWAHEWLADRFAWTQLNLKDGAGLSRENRLSARDVITVLEALEPHQALLRDYPLQSPSGHQLHARAKSGTLTGVHTLAGYVQLDDRQYKFVFLFNRAMPMQFRERLLQQLADALVQRLES